MLLAFKPIGIKPPAIVSSSLAVGVELLSSQGSEARLGVPVLLIVEYFASVCVRGSAPEGPSLGAVVTSNPKPTTVP